MYDLISKMYKSKFLKKKVLKNIKFEHGRKIFPLILLKMQKNFPCSFNFTKFDRNTNFDLVSAQLRSYKYTALIPHFEDTRFESFVVQKYLQKHHKRGLTMKLVEKISSPKNSKNCPKELHLGVEILDL